MTLLEGILMGSTAIIVGSAVYHAIRSTDKKVGQDKEELYGAMDSIPEEHRTSVARILGVLEKQQPREVTSYRIRSLLEKYGFRN